MEYVYFPTSGIVSMLSLVDETHVVEVALVGKEGVVGLPAFFDEEKATARCLVQVEGEALRLSTQAFHDATQTGMPLRASLNHYANQMFSVVARAAGCNARHSVLQRYARWLLLYRDRLEGDEIHITHEFLAWMLAVRRPSITDAARRLRDSGVISYRRAQVRILDRQRLESIACECWRYGSPKPDISS